MLVDRFRCCCSCSVVASVFVFVHVSLFVFVVRSPLKLRCQGTTRDAVVADLEGVRKRTVTAFQTAQKRAKRSFDGITVKAYKEKYNKCPKEEGEHVALHLVDGVLQDCVLWAQKGAGEFTLEVEDIVGTNKEEELLNSAGAIREGDIDREFTTQRLGLVGKAEDLDTVKMNPKKSVDLEGLDVETLRALKQLGITDEASQKQDPEERTSDSEHSSIEGEEESEDDLLAKMTGQLGKKKGSSSKKKAAAKSSGKINTPP